MTEWKEETINDVCIKVTDGSHSSPKAVEKGYYMASVKDFRKYDFDFSECKQISEEDYFSLVKSGCVPEKEDILIGKDGARYFEDIIVYEQDEKPALLSSIAILRCDKEKIDPYFLYYMLQVPSVRKDVKDNYGSGSAIPRIILKDFKRMPIRYPSLEIQKSLITILKNIDSKIKLNEKINRNLSEQALSMVNEWEASEKEHIEYKKVEDVAELNPETYSSKDDWDFVNYLDTSSITEGTISELAYIVPSEEKLPSRAKRKLRCKDIVYSTVRPNQKHYGFINEPVENMLASTGFVVVRAKAPQVCSELLYLLITRDLVTEKMQQIAEGSTSTFPSIKPSDLGAYEIPVPQTGCNIKLIEGLSSIFECIHANQKENQRLAELRDGLLPKLMSGELDVTDLDI